MAIYHKGEVDMDELKQEIEQLENELQTSGDRNEYMRISNLISDKRIELIQQQEKEEREQKVQEVNETNSEVAIAIFDALVPDSKPFETAIGLTEFGGWRTDFYQLIDGILADRTKLMSEKHSEEIAQKDDVIRELRIQKADVETHLDATNDLLASSQAVLEQKVHLAEELSKALIDEQNANATLHTQAADKDAQIAELQSKLEAAQKSKEQSKPSQSFTERMEAIKSKNEARIKSAAELALENAAPFRGKISLPEIKQQESPTPSEPVVAVEPSGDQLPAAETTENVSEGQFPIIAAPEVGPVTVPTQSVDEQVVEPATKAWVSGELARIKQEILAEVQGVA